MTMSVPLTLSLLPLHRRVRRDDNVLPPEEEDRLLCDPDLPALHHDRHPLPGLLLAQQRVRPRPHRVR